MQLKTAMLLAAGRGERLRPLTDTTPKPLLPVFGKPFIVHHLERLAALQFERVVINVHHLAQQIIDVLGDGSQFGLDIIYSKEEVLLGPGGAIKNALHLLGRDPFLLLSGDIYTDFPLEQWLQKDWSMEDAWVYAVLTDKQIGAKGDFDLNEGQLVANPNAALVYASISVMDPSLFDDQAPGHASLMPAFNKAIMHDRARGMYYEHVLNINTLAEYQALKVR